MTDLEYNQYIENYLKKDKTKSAIMLTAPWGMGKSHYIQNSLIPYLNTEEKRTCVVVSLYGLNDVKEINRIIYWDLRLKLKTPKKGSKSEALESGKFVVKAFLNGGLSFLGIDPSMSDRDFDKLFSSIDLTGKLIILEDLERSSIPIKHILGYVNNLTEHDGAKVLLVANEQEIKTTHKSVVAEEGKETSFKWAYTPEAEEYLEIKEKTVSDTIVYRCNYDVAIVNILELFENTKLKRLLDERNPENKPTIVSDILQVMTILQNYNLRSLIFACQKTADIFSCFSHSLDSMFFKHVFLSNVAFALRLKSNADLRWGSKTNPQNLGTSQYPLHRFCYDYIVMQDLDLSEIQRDQEAFIEQKEFETKQKIADSALSILYDFPTQNSVVLTVVVNQLKNDLRNVSLIPFSQYGKVANYLLVVKELIDDPIAVDECKSIMLKNLEASTKEDEEIAERLRFHDSVNFWLDSQQEEYNAFITDMCAALHSRAFSYLDEEDPLSYLEQISKLMCDNENDIRRTQSFMDQIDIKKILIGLEQADASQISKFRMGLLNVYRPSNIRQFLPNDKDSLGQLLSGVQALLDDKKGSDKVVRLQYLWLTHNLELALNNY